MLHTTPAPLTIGQAAGYSVTTAEGGLLPWIARQRINAALDAKLSATHADRTLNPWVRQLRDLDDTAAAAGDLARLKVYERATARARWSRPAHPILLVPRARAAHRRTAGSR